MKQYIEVKMEPVTLELMCNKCGNTIYGTLEIDGDHRVLLVEPCQKCIDSAKYC